MEIADPAQKNKIILYGFKNPFIGNMMKPVDYYLSKSIDEYEKAERNVAVLTRIYQELPMNFIK